MGEPMTQRICMALDLVDDAAPIEEYERWHGVGNSFPAAGPDGTSLEMKRILRLTEHEGLGRPE
jgi:hypothetical protein